MEVCTAGISKLFVAVEKAMCPIRFFLLWGQMPCAHQIIPKLQMQIEIRIKYTVKRVRDYLYHCLVSGPQSEYAIGQVTDAGSSFARLQESLM